MNARAIVDRLAAAPTLPLAGSAVTLAIGLFFIFVWAPHPWGWQGIDQYHQIAIELARGRPFETFDVPWGYGYFVAAFYWLFGPTPLPVLLAQALFNATIPLMVYAYGVRAFDRRVAAVATVFVACLSFNTVYVSTESTDSISTALFMASVLAFVRGRDDNRWRWFVAAGICTGIAAQFRPNLVLLPFVLGGLNWLLGPQSWRRAAQGGVVAMVAVALMTPWTWRNYQLSGQFLPTSTHGGVQLWYGTLQVGGTLDSRAHNPRSIFATAPFDYTSLMHQPVEVDIHLNCGPGVPEAVTLVYRFEQGPLQRVALAPAPDRHYVGAIPSPDREARIYYFVEVAWPAGSTVPVQRMPAGGNDDPMVYFVSDRHMADLDRDDALLDLFDVVRIVRHIAWAEPLRAANTLDADRSGAVDERDLRLQLRLMLRGLDRREPSIDRLRELAVGPDRATVQFSDGSTLVVPRQWDERLTDLTIGIGAAEFLMFPRYRFTQPSPEPRADDCPSPEGVRLNRSYFRVQPHEQRRYMALALDNIRRAPADYAWSVIYRAVRLFVIMGSEDPATTQQFNRSGAVYAAGTGLSLSFLVFAVVGVWIGWKRGYRVVLPLALILYIPATIAFVLTNMRYTTTVQPLVLTFVAVTAVATADRLGNRRG